MDLIPSSTQETVSMFPLNSGILRICSRRSDKTIAKKSCDGCQVACFLEENWILMIHELLRLHWDHICKSCPWTDFPFSFALFSFPYILPSPSYTFPQLSMFLDQALQHFFHNFIRFSLPKNIHYYQVCQGIWEDDMSKVKAYLIIYWGKTIRRNYLSALLVCWI